MAEVAALAERVPPSEWKASSIKVETEEEAAARAEKKEAPVEVADEDKAAIAQLRTELLELTKAPLRAVRPAEFEKDNDRNHHVDWITSACNLRCFNYNIKAATRAEVRMTAGRIIPAVATTTATITGFIMLEAYKHLARAPLEAFRAVTIDLGTNSYVLENLPDKEVHRTEKDGSSPCYPNPFSIWDQVVIDKGDLTVDQFLEALSAQHFKYVADAGTSACGGRLCAVSR